MKESILLIYLFAGIWLANTAYCQDPPTQQTDRQNNNDVIQQEENAKEKTDKSL